MKVILIEDVKSLGKKGQLVEVNDGYARNFILAKKLGLEATPKNLNDLKLKKANDEKVAKEIYEDRFRSQALPKTLRKNGTSLALRRKILNASEKAVIGALWFLSMMKCEKSTSS